MRYIPIQIKFQLARYELPPDEVFGCVPTNYAYIVRLPNQPPRHFTASTPKYVRLAVNRYLKEAHRAGLISSSEFASHTEQMAAVFASQLERMIADVASRINQLAYLGVIRKWEHNKEEPTDQSDESHDMEP